ncbi:DNA cytosine methyltransferase [Devosia sp.]|uniref:DNA cytosine methyltransferase n=1 Tax=Devosia sp. TaxID=1871048 RepID=UPI002614863C|nr:DNA cytosine methyltransferase [Devosia sp.]
MGPAYYNEIDPAAAAVLTHLIADGVVAPGVVDTRSIKDVQPDDLAGFTQCHFFAGGGLWSVAARLAGWDDTRPLWSGSCPCQPFSAAGKGLGADDPRHLWPDFHRLISACRPPVVVGEQVAGKAGYGWLDGVRSDLAGEGYASRGVDIPACAVDAPHQRNRLYWVAVVDAESERWGEGRPEHVVRGGRATAPGSDAPGPLDNRVSDRLRCAGEPVRSGWQPADHADGQGDLADSAGFRRQVPPAGGQPAIERAVSNAHSYRNGSAWAGADWIDCHDGKARRTKPGVRLLVDGLPGRVDLWRVGGNAIVPILAAEVLSSLIETELA